MSFDQYAYAHGSGPSSSTLDVTEPAAPAKRSKGVSRRRPHAGDEYAATLDKELVAPRVDAGETSDLTDVFMGERAFTVDGDIFAFGVWLERNRAGSLLELVARNLAANVHALDVRAVLDGDDEDPPTQRVVLLARVPAQDEQALDRLFDFTASDWWLKVARSTRNAIIVDIQRS